jgi:hypothetical protein
MLNRSPRYLNQHWPARLSPRQGFTSVDLIMSTLLLTVVMSTATSLCFRIHQVWKGIAQQRVATHELANHLEVLTRLKPDQVDAALEQLQPSEACRPSLPNPKLRGQRSRDELGVRISLELQWDGLVSPLQAHLSGWLIDSEMPKPQPSGDTSESARDTTSPAGNRQPRNYSDLRVKPHPVQRFTNADSRFTNQTGPLTDGRSDDERLH